MEHDDNAPSNHIEKVKVDDFISHYKRMTLQSNLSSLINKFNAIKIINPHKPKQSNKLQLDAEKNASTEMVDSKASRTQEIQVPKLN